MACAKCLLPYPDELLNPVIGRSADCYKPVCGICALAIVNEIHGAHMKRFHGEMADEFRRRALNWRRKHPNAKAERAPAAIREGV